MKKKKSLIVVTLLVVIASLLCVGCSCTSNNDDKDNNKDKISVPYTSASAHGKDPAQVEQDFKNAGFTNVRIREGDMGVTGTGLEHLVGTVQWIKINASIDFTTSDKYSKDTPVLIEVYSGAQSSVASTNNTKDEADLGAYITVFQEGVNKYLNDVKYPSAFNYNEYKFVNVDDTDKKVIGTTKISIKNVPEKMDAIVIFTPGADVNQYVTHSVVVNGKIYQDDGSYAEATNRLLDKQ